MTNLSQLDARVSEVINVPHTGLADPSRILSHGRPMFDQILADLQSEGVQIPAAVAVALDLDRQLIAELTEPEPVTRWLADQDLAGLTGSDIATRMAANQLAISSRNGSDIPEIRAHILDRAIGALAEDLDGVIEQLRGKWTPAAKVMAEAVAAGIHAETDADTAIADDILVTHWRRLADAAATLDRISTLDRRARFITGYPADEVPRHGRSAWLTASGDGPVDLPAPSARTETAISNGQLRIGRNRTPVAQELQREQLEEYEAATARASTREIETLRARIEAEKRAGGEDLDSHRDDELVTTGGAR